MKYFYKIRHVKTGLYKNAGHGSLRPGSTYGWSKQGKVWKNISALMLHFSLYSKKDALEQTDWVIECFPAEATEIKSVPTFLMERWGITK